LRNAHLGSVVTPLMIAIIVALLVLWAAAIVVGLAIKAVFWLFIVGLVGLVLTAVGAAVAHLRRQTKPS
jgi:hypothetical protein